jgi:hypothetical protein
MDKGIKELTKKKLSSSNVQLSSKVVQLVSWSLTAGPRTGGFSHLSHQKSREKDRAVEGTSLSCSGSPFGSAAAINLLPIPVTLFVGCGLPCSQMTSRTLSLSVGAACISPLQKVSTWVELHL